MDLKALTDKIPESRRNCRIYALTMIDDLEWNPLYIGSTCKSLESRFQGHLRNPSPRLKELIMAVGAENIQIVELLRVSEEDRFFVEGRVIRLALAYGHELANKVIPQIEGV